MEDALKKILRVPSAGTAIATLALVVVVGGGTAFAASSAPPSNSVGNAQLKHWAVSNSKIAPGAVSYSKINASTRDALKGQKGATGAAGKTGATGQTGANGYNPAVPVITLSGTWSDHSGTGTSSLNASGVKLTGTGTDSFAGISTNVLNDLTPADLSTISYTASYTGAAGNNAEPYFKLKLVGTDGSCGSDDVVYAPASQSPTLSYQDETQTFDVTAPFSTVGVHGDDAQPTDGNYPTAIHSTTGGDNESGEKICLAEIIFDGGSGASGGTATISNVTFAGNGLPIRTYVFS